MDFHIQNSARDNIARSGLAERVGAFLIRFDPVSDHRFLNYAIPDDGADPSPSDVAELVAAFTSRGLVPRLEYVGGRAPGLEKSLVDAGFSLESRMPLMAVRTGELPDVVVPSDVTVLAPSTMDEYRAAVTVQYAAFGESNLPTDEEVKSRMMTAVERGGLAAVAVTSDGTVLGTGQVSPVAGGIAEVAGIAVAEAARGRGIGAAITADLTGRAFRAGADMVWLDPSGDTAQRLYERVGYRVVGEKVHIVRE